MRIQNCKYLHTIFPFVVVVTPFLSGFYPVNKNIYSFGLVQHTLNFILTGFMELSQCKCDYLNAKKAIT